MNTHFEPYVYIPGLCRPNFQELDLPSEIKRTKEVGLHFDSVLPTPQQSTEYFPLLHNWREFVTIAAEQGQHCNTKELLQLVVARLRQIRAFYKEGNGDSLYGCISSMDDEYNSFKNWLEGLAVLGYNCHLGLWLFEQGFTHVRWVYHQGTCTTTVLDKPMPNEDVTMNYMGVQFIQQAYQLFKYLLQNSLL